MTSFLTGIGNMYRRLWLKMHRLVIEGKPFGAWVVIRLVKSRVD